MSLFFLKAGVLKVVEIMSMLRGRLCVVMAVVSAALAVWESMDAVALVGETGV